ncbi:MAG: bifunctional nicotinamidase/pyrazinamidase [bacterium]
MNCLIVTDIQYDFCPGGALPVKEGDLIIPVINRLRRLFATVVFIQDWHPKDHISFASNHNKKVGEVIQVKGTTQVLWPDHCVQNTQGARLREELDVKEDDFIVRKGTDPEVDSYSGFFDNQRVHKTTLDCYLQEKRAQHLYITGLATDYCVKFTVLDALDLGYQVTVVRDATRGVDLNSGDVDIALKEMRKKGAQILDSDEVIKALQTK